MSRIHLLLDYKRSKNKFLVLFVSGITDFAYRSNEFLSSCLSVRDLFYEREEEASVNPEEICDLLRSKILDSVSEKTVKVTYVVYAAMSDLVYYCHRYPHGKKNGFICEKIMFAEMKDSSSINNDKILDMASMLLPFDFRFRKDSKHADSVVMNNESSIFYADENYEMGQDLIDAISLCQTKLNIELLYVFCVK